MDSRPIPSEISRANLRDLRIVWKDGHQSTYPARYLRLRCPCAGCVDEWTGRRVLKSADVSEDVAPTSLQLVGRYALRVHWSDSHSHGQAVWPNTDFSNTSIDVLGHADAVAVGDFGNRNAVVDGGLEIDVI